MLMFSFFIFRSHMVRPSTTLRNVFLNYYPVSQSFPFTDLTYMWTLHNTENSFEIPHMQSQPVVKSQNSITVTVAKCLKLTLQGNWNAQISSLSPSRSILKSSYLYWMFEIECLSCFEGANGCVIYSIWNGYVKHSSWHVLLYDLRLATVLFSSDKI